jgi:hypothetical protein
MLNLNGGPLVVLNAPVAGLASAAVAQSSPAARTLMTTSL